MQIKRVRKVHPVIVVGSGASGGMAAWNLTRKGINVLMLDAGNKFDRSTFWTHVQPWEWRERDRAGREAAAVLPRHEGAAVPHAARQAVRADPRVGARRQDQRVGPRQPALLAISTSRARRTDGWEIPWPISYADVAPYYDKVEQLIGVCGGTDDSDALPGSKFLLPPPPPRCGERLLQQAFGEGEHPDRAPAGART